MTCRLPICSAFILLSAALSNYRVPFASQIDDATIRKHLVQTAAFKLPCMTDFLTRVHAHTRQVFWRVLGSDPHTDNLGAAHQAG
jgi:hypothetical protein